MKKLLLSAVLVIALVSCKENTSRVYVQEPVEKDIVITPTTSNIGDNLDLQALGELVKESNSAEEIENKLNTSGSINNLDLDQDGQVDFIKVNEVNDNSGKGFVFLVDGPNGSSEVATISVSQNGDLANVNIQGNPQYYGSNSYHSSSHLVRDMMIMNYLYSGYHRPYYSPYRYGHYPRTYQSYRSTYSPSSTTRTTRTRTTSHPSTSSTKTSSYGNSSYKARPVSSASNRTKQMASPTRSQKSFNVTSPSKSKPNTSGFGSSNRSSSSSYKSKPSSSSSYGSSNKSSNRSSFGSSSRSSSRSSGSSSRSSSRRSH